MVKKEDSKKNRTEKLSIIDQPRGGQNNRRMKPKRRGKGDHRKV